jgi:hypothetical protein
MKSCCPVSRPEEPKRGRLCLLAPSAYHSSRWASVSRPPSLHVFEAAAKRAQERCCPRVRGPLRTTGRRHRLGGRRCRRHAAGLQGGGETRRRAFGTRHLSPLAGKREIRRLLSKAGPISLSGICLGNRSRRSNRSTRARKKSSQSESRRNPSSSLARECRLIDQPCNWSLQASFSCAALKSVPVVQDHDLDDTGPV